MSNKNEKNIAMIARFPWVGVSSPLLNTIEFYLEKGYNVDLFIDKNNKFDIDECIKAKITLFYFDYRFNIKHIYIQCRQIYKYRKLKNRYDFIIGYDPEGLFTAFLFHILWNVPFIYHSLELIESNNCSISQKILRFIEYYCIRRALLCLTQDEKRKEIISEDNGISSNRIMVCYNSSIGEPILDRDDYFRRKFNIGTDKYLVIAVGSFLEEHSIDKIIKSVDYWPPDFVLVLHGWFCNTSYDAVLRDEIKKRCKRIFLSTDILPFDQKYIIFQSVDIGLVFFEPVNKNFTYGAGSAGKLFDFMQTGVPIVANNIPGMRELVEENGIGIVVDKAEDIGLALNTLVANKAYRQKALDAYNRFEFRNCYTMIFQHILSLLNLAK